MTLVLLGLGLVCVIEGLVLALAPARLVQVLALLVSLGTERSRFLGLAAVALGVLILAVARLLAV